MQSKLFNTADLLTPFVNSFKDAVATIRRTSIEFQYQLVITRAYEQGEEQLLEEDAESEFKVKLSSTTSSDVSTIALPQPKTNVSFSSTKLSPSDLVSSMAMSRSHGATSPVILETCGSLSAQVRWSPRLQAGYSS
jgi:hypothetical protein